MGKSNRTKQQKQEELLKRELKREQEKKAEARLNRIGAVVTGIAVGVIAIAVTAFFSINSLLDNGYFLRKNVSVESKNYEINNSMFSYFLYEEYRDFINENYESISEMGLKADKSLKKQESYFDDGTWYDHFASLAAESLKENVALCEAAEEDGISLSEEELAEIDYIIAEMREDAENTDRTELEYYEYMYGRGVTREDITDCLKITLLAEKYKTTLYNSFSLTEEDYSAEYNKNPEKYSTVSVLKYSFNYEEFYKNLTDKSTVDECNDALYSDIIKDYAENYETELNRDLVDMLLISNITADYSYGENDIIDKFGFTSSAKAGDFYLDRNDDGCTVYILKSAPQASEDKTKNVSVIYSTNSSYGGESYAESFLSNLSDEITSADNSSLRFKICANLYSEDLESKANYGSYKNLKSTDIESAAAEWIFSDERKSGDTEIIAGEEGQYLLLFEGEGLPSYKADIYEAKFTEYYNNLTDKLATEYSVSVDEDNINKISL